MLSLGTKAACAERGLASGALCFALVYEITRVRAVWEGLEVFHCPPVKGHCLGRTCPDFNVAAERPAISDEVNSRGRSLFLMVHLDCQYKNQPRPVMSCYVL